MVFVENFKDIPLEEITEDAFLGYAMSTLKGRSFADVRDGLKPVQRRILYAMHKLKNTYDKPYKKSARIVGDVIGKYHPHGDSSVYDAMVRMSQDWKVRYTLVQGHGNFGSMDGDAVAAMRYTESRLEEISNLMLDNINYNTVDMRLNFDEQEEEPVILPALLPNLLVNGVRGVATGFATEILPNNLTEVCEAILAYIENPQIDVEELADCFMGPDFPTGGLLLDSPGIRDIYTKGRGEIVVRGEVEFDYMKNTECLIIKSVPMDVNKEKLIGEIKALQIAYNNSYAEFEKESKKVNGKNVDLLGMDFMTVIRDETDSSNKSYDVRIVIELKEGTNPRTVLNNLYKRTALQKSYTSNNLALVPKIVNGDEVVTMPTMCNVKVMVEEYVKHQFNVIKRKARFKYDKCMEDMYLLSAVIKALGQLDKTVEIIKNATSRDSAISELMAFLDIEKEQASHVLQMRLQSLASFEQDDKIEEYNELVKRIEELKAIMESEQKVKEILVAEVLEMKEKFGDERRTKIIPNVADFTDETLIPKEQVIVMMTNNMFVKRMPYEKYKLQRRNGKGSNGMAMFEGDFVKHMEIMSTHDTLCLFTKKGMLFKLKPYELPIMGDKSKGVNIKGMFDIGDDEIQTIVSVTDFDDNKTLLFATKNGVSKRTKLSEYTYGVKSSIRAIKLKDDDELISVALSEEAEEDFVTFITKNGVALTTEVQQIKTVSRVGSGVTGISLRAGDEVIQCLVHKGDGMLLVATNVGLGKRTPMSEYRVIKRKGRGVSSIKLTDGAFVIGALIVGEEDEVIQLTKLGKVMKFKVNSITPTGRVTQGLHIIKLDDDDELISINTNKEFPEDEDEIGLEDNNN